MKFLSAISLLTLLAVSGACEQTYAKGKSSKETISSGNAQRTYYLFVPEGGGPQQKHPLLLLFHGSGRNGQSLMDKWKDLGDKENIIIAAPDSIDSPQWTIGKDGPDFLRDLVDALKAKYPIDERRVYLFGHSAGAGFALYMSLFESEYFAAMAIHAGALPPEDYWVVARATRKIPMAIWVGDRDSFFPLKLVRGTRDVLVSKGFSVELTEMPNHNHWYYDLAPKINRSAWEFLRKHQLASDPQFKQYKY
jgi:poly(3-hydroxybutyrate) depolymerase